jgi:hypothetical protein
MKKLFSLALLAAWLLSGGTALASVGVQDSDGTELGPVMSVKEGTGMTFTVASGILSIGGGAVGSDGNWTSDGLAVSLDLAPTKFIATASSGDFAATGFTVGTGDLTFAQGGKIDGDTNGTLKLIEASDTLSFIFSGTTIQLDSSDGGFQFAMSDATEGYVDFLTNNDTDDYLRISTVTNVPTIVTAGTSNLTIAPDGGTTAITGALTVSTTATLSSTVTLQNGETIVNSTDNTVTVGGGTNTILNVLDTGTSDSDASIQLQADASADNGDDWQIQADGATNSLFFRNDTSGSQATILTLATTGAITTTGDLDVAGTTPLVTIGDGGDEDAGIQINSDTNDFYIASENTLDDFMIGSGSSIGTTPILTITDAGVATHTGSTDGDLTVYGAGTTASDAYLRLVGDAGADALDRWQLFNDSSAGDLIFQADDTVAGTYVTKLTIDGTSGDVTLTGDIVNENADSLLMNTDDSLVYSSNDENATIRALGFEAKTAMLKLAADQDDDATDQWALTATTTGTLTIGNDASVAGTDVTKVTIDGATGGVTLTGGLTLSDAEVISNPADDTVRVASNDAAQVLEVYSPLATDGDATLRLTADATADNGDEWEVQHDGATNNLVFQNDTSGSQVAKLTLTTGGVLTTANGTVHTSSTATALTPGAAVTLTVVAGLELFTDTIVTDNQDQTINASAGGSAGDRMTIKFVTDAAGSGDEVITFGTNMLSTGTLTLANLAADVYTVSFVSDGTNWIETSRTTVQTT